MVARISGRDNVSPGTSWILYGAYGFTGRLVARRAVARGLSPVLAGRNRERLQALAGELGLESRVFGLDEGETVRRGIRGAQAVLSCAGPFADTWRPLAEACLAEGAAYLDITGEIEVLEGIHEEFGAPAREAGVAMIPAVGFDVVPTDCAAALAVRELREEGETPRRLDLAIHFSGSASGGSLRTALRRLAKGSAVVREGEIVTVPLGSVERRIPFADRPREAVAIPWGDLSTAPRSSGASEVRVFATITPSAVRVAGLLGRAGRIPPVRRAMEWLVGTFVQGPDEDQRATGSCRVRAEATGWGGGRAVVELVTPNAYTLTARSAVAAVERVLTGDPEVAPGSLTPSQAFGRGFAEGIEGVRRVV